MGFDHRERLRELVARLRLREFSLGFKGLSTAKKVLAALKKKNQERIKAVSGTRLQTKRSTDWSVGYYRADPDFKVNEINVPRKYINTIAGRMPSAGSKSPLATSLHEHGHAADHLAPKAAAVAGRPTLYRDIGKFAQRQRVKLNLEKRANKNVLSQIQKSGTPEQAAAWKKYANRQMHRYRNAFMHQIHERIDDTISLKATPIMGESVQPPNLSLGRMPLSYKRDLLQKFPHLRKSATQLSARRSGRLVELGSMGSSRILRVHEAFKKVDSKLQAAQKKVGGDYMRAADLPKWFAIQSIRDYYGRIDDLQLKKFKYRVNRVKRSELQAARSGRLVEFVQLMGGSNIPASMSQIRTIWRTFKKAAPGKIARSTTQGSSFGPQGMVVQKAAPGASIDRAGLLAGKTGTTNFPITSALHEGGHALFNKAMTGSASSQFMPRLSRGPTPERHPLRGVQIMANEIGANNSAVQAMRGAGIQEKEVSEFLKYRQRGIDSHMRSARDHVTAAPVGLTPERHQQIKGAFNRWLTDWRRSGASPNARLSMDAPELLRGQ